jgi:futalosine hydrolase
MRYLIVAATDFEVAPFLARYPFKPLTAIKQNGCLYQYISFDQSLHIDVLITGIGLVHTAFHTAWQLRGTPYDWAINLGIAGCFDSNIKLGSVVQIISEQTSDLGIETTQHTFEPISALPFFDADACPYEAGYLHNPHRFPFDYFLNLPQFRGSSCNTVTGSVATAQLRRRLFTADTESMEGSAFFYACLQGQTPFIQLRGLSNYVGKRDKDKWEINLAIQQVNGALYRYFSNLYPHTSLH